MRDERKVALEMKSISHGMQLQLVVLEMKSISHGMQLQLPQDRRLYHLKFDGSHVLKYTRHIISTRIDRPYGGVRHKHIVLGNGTQYELPCYYAYNLIDKVRHVKVRHVKQ